jgi:hypothetical protein
VYVSLLLAGGDVCRIPRHMETLLTIMGWVSVGILAWFILGFLRSIVRGMQKPKARTDNVNKEMY